MDLFGKGPNTTKGPQWTADETAMHVDASTENMHINNITCPNISIPIPLPCDGLICKPSSPIAASKLADALAKLRQVDIILEQLGLFWANTEIVLDVLTKKGQHAEQFIAFAHKPRLLARFQERMSEYRGFWDGVRTMCHNYISGVSEDAMNDDRGYNFLDQNNHLATPDKGNNKTWDSFTGSEIKKSPEHVTKTDSADSIC